MKNDVFQAVAIIAVILIAVVLAPKYGPGTTRDSSNTSTYPDSHDAGSGGASIESRESDTSRISINIGNARYAYQPYEEYIILANGGQDPVNITGWFFKNGKANRPSNIGGQLQYFQSDIASIPRGAKFIAPVGASILEDIVIEPGDSAIITTGSIGSSLPYKIVSFKENICSGYLEDMPEYNFTPALARNCPRPAQEAGLDKLDAECRKFVENLPSCQTPKFDTRDSEGEICYGCVNGKLLSNACYNFIKEHFNYGACIANHSDEPKFSGKIWRIFLGKGWEMWARDYESIELFDPQGKLIKSISY